MHVVIFLQRLIWFRGWDACLTYALENIPVAIIYVSFLPEFQLPVPSFMDAGREGRGCKLMISMAVRLKVVCGGGVDCRIKAPETDLSPFLPAGTTVVSLLHFVWQIMSPASWWKISKLAATALLKFIINCRRSVTCEHHHTEETTIAEKSLNSNLSFKPATAKPKPMNTGKSSSKRACKGGQR